MLYYINISCCAHLGTVLARCAHSNPMYQWVNTCSFHVFRNSDRLNTLTERCAHSIFMYQCYITSTFHVAHTSERSLHVARTQIQCTNELIHVHFMFPATQIDSIHSLNDARTQYLCTNVILHQHFMLRTPRNGPCTLRALKSNVPMS
jgi:hypothetical protein